MKKAVFFDMNETLLNLSVLQESFEKYFEDRFAVKYWFSKLLHTSAVTGIMDSYRNFGELAEVVLENLFYESGHEFTESAKSEILGSFRSLPAFEDVPEALILLRQNNIRTIAVSNSSMEMIREQLGNAGIIALFNAFYSVDSVRKYKPFKEIYQYVAAQELLSTEDIVMVATHDWDLFGAKSAGLTTAYIERKKEIFNPYYVPADLNASNLIELAQKIIEL